jgi:hypothetical protein
VADWAEVEDVANGILEEGYFEGEGAEEVATRIDQQTRSLMTVSADEADLSTGGEEEEGAGGGEPASEMSPAG